MPRRSLCLTAIGSLLALTALGCYLGGRVANDAADAAVSTLEALQPEMATAVATIPAALPEDFPAITEGPPILDLGAAISGSLSYPSEGIPPLVVVAFDVTTRAPAASIESEAGQATYSLAVPPGVYNVVAYTTDRQRAGGYTAAAPCSLSVECSDPSLLPIPVANGMASGDVDPADG
jgi:hypothetical protein